MDSLFKPLVAIIDATIKGKVRIIDGANVIIIDCFKHFITQGLSLVEADFMKDFIKIYFIVKIMDFINEFIINFMEVKILYNFKIFFL